MTYRVELTARAERDLRYLYRYIHANDSALAHTWFNGLEAAILSLGEHPTRCAVASEDKKLRQLFYGNKPHIYRIIFAVNERKRIITILHIRHSARLAQNKDS